MTNGSIPAPKKLFPKLTKKAVLMAATVPEGIIMLTVAGILDLIGLVLFIFSLFGVGIPISFLLDWAGVLTIGLWTILRSFFRPLIGKAIGKATEKVTKMAVSVGKTPGETNISPSPATELGKGAAQKGLQASKVGVGIGLGGIATVATALIEFIPFLGDILPTWTARVFYELISGQITEL